MSEKILVTCLRIEHYPSKTIQQVNTKPQASLIVREVTEKNPKKRYYVAPRRVNGKAAWFVVLAPSLKLYIGLSDGSEHWIYIDSYFRGKTYAHRGTIKISKAFTERIARYMPQEVRVTMHLSIDGTMYYQIEDDHVMTVWLEAVIDECRTEFR